MKNLLLASMLFAFSSIVCHAQDTAAIRLALGEKDYKDYLDWVALGVGGLPHTHSKVIVPKDCRTNKTDQRSYSNFCY